MPSDNLTQALLIEALRLHLMERSHEDKGWLFALADRQMHAVMTAMHSDPGRKWTLEDLARVAGMSRSTFAVRFKDTVGEPAMDYEFGTIDFMILLDVTTVPERYWRHFAG